MPNETRSQETVEEIQRFAHQVFGVESESAFIWQYSGRPLTSGHMVFMLKDIATALAENDLVQLHQLIFNVTDRSLARYDESVGKCVAAANSRRRYENVRMQIDADMKTSVTHHAGRSVARYYRVPRLSAYVAFVLLCDTTDPSRRGRAIITGRWDGCGAFNDESCTAVLHEWTEDLTARNDRDATVTADRLGVEYAALKRWIVENVSTDTTARKNIFPYEYALRCVDEKASVTARLAAELIEKKLDSGGSARSHLVFIVPGELVRHAEYARLRIVHLIEELTPGKDVYVVVDVGVQHGVSRLTDLVPAADKMKNVSVKARVALEPHSAASCAILHVTYV